MCRSSGGMVRFLDKVGSLIKFSFKNLLPLNDCMGVIGLCESTSKCMKVNLVFLNFVLIYYALMRSYLILFSYAHDSSH